MHSNSDLLDLISERYHFLRKKSVGLWNNRSDIYLSNSEWIILAKVYQQEQTTISYVTRHVGISRQATHKFVKRLEEKGLVEVKKLTDNKKEKGIQLTELGKECFEKNESLKAEIEERIADTIGVEQVKQLKEFLQADWGL